MKRKLKKEELKRFWTAVLASVIVIGTTLQCTVPVFADETGDDETVTSLKIIEENIAELEESIINYDAQTDAVGMMITIYQAAVDDILEILDDDPKTKGENLSQLITPINAKLAALETRLNTAIETEASEPVIENIKTLQDFHNGYLSEITSLQNVIDIAINDPDILDTLMKTLNTAKSEIADAKTEYTTIRAKYDEIQAEFNEFDGTYSADNLGYTGEDENGNPVVYLNGDSYQYSVESKRALDEDHPFISVYTATEGPNGPFDFYVSMEGIYVIDTGVFFETSLGDIVRALRQRLVDVYGKLEEGEEPLNGRAAILETKQQKLDESANAIDLGLNEEVVELIREETISLIDSYTELKNSYVAIKSTIYSGTYTSDLLGNLDLASVITNLKGISGKIEGIMTDISTAVTEENLSSKDIVAFNNYTTSLNAVKSNIDDDITMFTLVKNAGDSVTEVTDLLKRVKLLEESNTTLKNSTSAASVAALTTKVNTLTSSNSTLTSKVNSLTSANSSLTSQLNKLKTTSGATTTAKTSTSTVGKTTTTPTSTIAKTTTTTSTSTTGKPITSTTANATTTKTTTPTATTKISSESTTIKPANVTVASNLSTDTGETIPSMFASQPTDGTAADVENFDFGNVSDDVTVETSDTTYTNDEFATSTINSSADIGSIDKQNQSIGLYIAMGGAGLLLIGMTIFTIWFFKFRKPNGFIYDEFDDDDENDDEDLDLAMSDDMTDEVLA